MSLSLSDNRRSQPTVSAQSVAEPVQLPARFAAVAAEKARLYDAERAQRLLLESALESLPLGVAILDGRTLAVRWTNQACRRQLSRISRVEGIEGRRLSDIVPGADENGLAEIVRRVAATGRPCADLAFAFPKQPADEGKDAGTVLARFALRKVGAFDGEAGEVMLQITEMTAQSGSRGRSRHPGPELPSRKGEREGLV